MAVHAVDFCCGAGGLTRGLADAGIEVVAGIDNNEGCRKTYECNTGASFVVPQPQSAGGMQSAERAHGRGPAWMASRLPAYGRRDWRIEE